jgi:GNAT superfamily N-acetyltransferase
MENTDIALKKHGRGVGLIYVAKPGQLQGIYGSRLMSDLLSKIIIRPLNSSDSLDELTDLLHRSYKKLADQGFRFHATHQDATVTKKRVDNSECYIATVDNRIIGTICYRSPANKMQHEYYDQPSVAAFGQYAVDPEYQNSGLGSKLLDVAEKCAIRDQAKEIAFDTAEGAADLINYYKKRGYQFVQYTQWTVTNYRSVIMSKKLNAL